MAKFDIVQWSDFVRGITDPELDRQMRDHLTTTKSRKDRETVAFLNRVAEVGRGDAELDLPEYAVRGARAISSLQRPQDPAQETGRLRYLPFEIVFDSREQPALVGTRKLQTSNRQLILRTAKYGVELRMEREKSPRSTVIIGQVLQRQEPPRPMPRVPVLVVCDQRIVARKITSRFGEFLVESLPREKLELCLLVEQDGGLRIPLDDDDGS